ncbi:MAG TPA: LysM peptidoglycan-binding domain-containing protein, partial [Chloroflexota bacterium]
RQQGVLLASQDSGGRGLIIVVPTSGPAVALSPEQFPSVVPSAVVASATAQPAVAENQYVVQPGDTLRSIALDQYGDADLWQTIYQTNRDAIGRNPDALVAGTILRIPSRQSR